MEIVGEVWGLATDPALVVSFRQPYGHFFPALRRIPRTTFVRQGATLWVVKARLWQVFVLRIPHDPKVALSALLDSVPMPVCRVARAPRCRLFRSDAAFGYDVAAPQTFFGVRCQVRVCWPGVITDVLVAPADVSEPVIARELARDPLGSLVGDCTSWSPLLTEALASTGLCLLAPYRSATKDPDPARSRSLSRLRYRIETILRRSSANWSSVTRRNAFVPVTAGISKGVVRARC